MIRAVESINHLRPVPGADYKLRLPNLLGAVPDGARIMTRPASEGLDEGQMFDGFKQWWDAFGGLNERWPVHYLSNEINHFGNRGHLDGIGGPSGYVRHAKRAIGRIESTYGIDAVLLCSLGGLLIPDSELDTWIEAHREIATWFETTYGWALELDAHLYMQGVEDNPSENETRMANALWDVQRQLMFRRTGWVSEFNDSGNGSVEFRVANCVEMQRRLAALQVRGTALFCNDSWQDHNGVEFGYSVGDQATIVAAAGEAPAPPPIRGGADMPDEYAVGDGIAKEMTKQGDVPASNEWYPIPGLALAAGVKGLYVYTPKGGTRTLPFK